MPVALDADGAPDLDALAAAVTPATRAIALCSPNDPTGAAVETAALHEFLARVPERVTVLLDEALAEFREPGSDAAALWRGPAPADRAQLLQGPRAGRAARRLRASRAGATGASSPPRRASPPPAQAAALWAAESGDARRRRAGATPPRAPASASSPRSPPLPVTITPGTRARSRGWRPRGSPARELAARLAAAKVYVAPGAAWGDESHVRAALRGPDAVDRLADALRSSLP